MTLQDLQRWMRPVSVVVDGLVYVSMILLGYVLAGLVVDEPMLPDASWRSLMQSVFLPMVLAPVGMYFCGMYRVDPYRMLPRSAERAFYGSLVAMLLIMAVTYAARGYLTTLADTSDEPNLSAAEILDIRWGIPFSVILVGCIGSAVAIPVWRFGANWLENAVLKLGKKRVRLVIVGMLAESDLDRLRQKYSPSYDLVGYVEGRIRPEGSMSIPCLGHAGELEEIFSRYDVDEAMVVAEQVSREFLMRSVEAAAAKGVRLWVAMDVYATVVSSGSPVLCGSTPVFELRESTMRGWEVVVKRVMDVFLSACALAVAIPFLLIPACIMIVMDSKGFPVFCQNRVGQGGRIFRLYKLRTMVIDADLCGPKLTEDDDPRITTFGKFLRKTSVDELPQLWNVLKGDMSLIGPRAVVPFVVEQFEEWERASLSVKPGLTGLAQVSGRDEIGFREKSLLNIYYIRNFSLWLDLRIIFSTIRVLLTMEGTGGTRRV